MKRWIVFVGAGLVVALAAVRLVLAVPAGPTADDVAVDTTGASARAGSSSQAATSAPANPTRAAAVRAAPSAIPTEEPKTIQPTPTPVVVQLRGTAISVERKPLLLLNPSTVRQGSSVGVTGSGFDAGAAVDLVLKQREDDKGDPITFVQVDKSGGFGGVTFAVPDTLPRGSFIVEAHQRNSDKLARATAVVAGGSPQVKLGTQVGKVGDTVELSAQGFGPDEEIKVYWNGLSGTTTGSLHTDGAGAVRQGSIRVPFGAVGNNGFVFVGDKSQSPVTVPFQLLNLYPNVELSSYAIKPDNVLSFSGKDFGPGERVLVYLNNPDGQPITAIPADANGAFDNAGGFVVPFGLRGKQTLIYIGEQSRAPTTASFDTLPYTPSVQPSTYGGRPGTTLAFYAVGFARNEVVHAYLGRTRDNPGHEVSCFLTDPQGNAAAAGSYVVPGNAQAGQLIFTLLGSKSQATATTALEVIASDVPVQVPAQPEFTCTLDDGSGTAAGSAAEGSTRAPSQPAAAPATSVPAATRTGTPAAAQAPRQPATPVAQPAATQQPVTQQPAAPTATPTPAEAPVPASGAAEAERTYAAEPGDTLPAIAQKVYGDPNLWRLVFEANRDVLGNNPNLLRVGTELKIPPRGG